MAEEKKIVCMVTSYKKGTIAVSHAGVRSDWMEQDGPGRTSRLCKREDICRWMENSSRGCFCL